MKKSIISIIFLLINFACQPIEKIDQIVIDNNQFFKFEVMSSSIQINQVYEMKLNEPYVGHTLKTTPIEIIKNWINENFKNTGNENKLIISIIEASLTQVEFENKAAKRFDEKTNFKYQLNILVEFFLQDDLGNMISSALVESSRSTTSGIYISLQEKEKIINELIYLGMNDLSIETKKILNKYMKDYLI